MKSVAWFSIGFLALACGGSTDTSTSTGGSSAGGSGGAGKGGTGGSGGGSGGTSPVGCPAAEPSGGQCTTPDLRCTYGDSVRPECRHDWICNQGAWVTTKSVCLQPAGECSSTPPAQGTICNTEAAVCDYADGTICLCNSCSAGPCAAPPPKWQCAPPPTGPGCPAIVPNDGTACSASEGTKCTYGNPCGPSGAVVVCTNGAWLWTKDIPCGA